MSESTMSGIKAGAGCALPLAASAGLLAMIMMAYNAFDNAVEEAATEHAASVAAAGQAAIDYATARQMDAVTAIALESARAMQTRATIMEVGYVLMLAILGGVVILILTAAVSWVIREAYKTRLTYLAVMGQLEEEDDDV